MMLALAVALILMLAVMTCAWATVVRTGNAGWTDVFWTFGTGATGVVVALSPWSGPASQRQMLVAALVAIWAIRLGSYIAIRVARTPEEDARYKLLKAEWGDDFRKRLFGLAIVQAPATTLLSVSIAAAALRPGAGLTLADGIGAAILAVAILGEGVADQQMKAFKADPANKGQIMDRGLWGLSRHPNYVFEWLGWVAYPVMAIDLSGGWPWGWAGLIAPVVMYLILTRLTGVPPLEAAMLKSRGKPYEDYQKRVGAFFPRISKA